MAIHSIELCAGVGMLGEGVSAAFQYLGIEHRTVCYVEREAPAASQLATLMEAGALHSAPIWSDLLTFRGADWRGLVDCVIAGFPCQDLSIAGRRAGLNGKRSGLFFNVLDIADASGAEFLVLENVAGIASATASVVDEAEGDLEERAAARVLGELADRGWNAEWVTLSASDVGASHGRARWFCFAWRVDDAGRVQWRTGHEQDRPGTPETREHEAHHGLADRSSNVADAECAERRPQCLTRAGCQPWHDGDGGETHCGTGIADPALGNTDSPRVHRGGPSGIETGCDEPSQPDTSMGDSGLQHQQLQQWEVLAESEAANGGVADTSQPRLPHTEQPGEPGEPESYGRGAVAELCGAPLFAPGPADPAWAEIIAIRPDLAPATEPGVRMLVDGMAILVDESRTHQLRQVGNGVVPLCASTAVVVLLRRAGFLRNKHPHQSEPT